MSRLIATTVQGLEDVAAEDLRQGFGLAARPARHGAVEVEHRQVGPALVVLNYWARGLHRVGVILAEGTVASLPDCYELVRGVDYPALVGPDQTFAIRASRHGEHAFGSPDIGRVVGQAVIDAYREATGRRLQVNLDAPDVILRAELIDDAFRLWLDATGDASLHRRGYRKRHHPASLKPSLAYLMLRVAGWSGEPLLDPMCGVGTIPIEAALDALGVAPGRFREGGWAHQRLRWIDAAEAERLSRQEAAGLADRASGLRLPGPRLAPDAPLEILGVERFARHVEGALENIEAAGLAGRVRIVQGDATDLGATVGAPGRFRLVVANPPFGRRIGRRGAIAGLYDRFCRSAAEVGVDRMVVLTELAGALEVALGRAGFRVSSRRRVLHGALETTLFVALRP